MLDCIIAGNYISKVILWIHVLWCNDYGRGGLTSFLHFLKHTYIRLHGEFIHGLKLNKAVKCI